MKKLLTMVIAAALLLGVAGTADVAKAEVITDNDLATPYVDDAIRIVNPPTVVEDVSDAFSLGSLTEGVQRPSNAVLTVDDELNVLGKDGQKLGKTFDEVYTEIKGSIIPVVRPRDLDAATAFGEYLDTVRSILDIAVCSDDVAVIKEVKGYKSSVRGILEVNEITGGKIMPVIQSAVKSGVHTVILPEALADRDTVEYFHARFVTVWAKADSINAVDLAQCINSGAYGVVSSDFGSVYRLLESYPQGAVTRMPFNVAHRGADGCHENSVSGCLRAVAYGATHVELDLYVTTDDEIVLMHDPNIDRTTNGSGNIESYSLEQLRQFKLDVSGALEDIPTIDDIFNALRDYDIIIITELKTTNDKLVPLLAEKIEQYNMADKVIAISFNTNQLVNANMYMPEVPVANLNSFGYATLGAALDSLDTYNAIIDTENKNANEKFNNALRDRGIVGWYWTYLNEQQVQSAIASGFVGLTNNAASCFRDINRRITGVEATVDGIEVGDTVKVRIETYSDKVGEEVDGTVLYVEDMDWYFDVIASYSDGMKTFYTQKFALRKEGVDPPAPPVDTGSDSGSDTGSGSTNPPAKGCSSCKGSASSAMVIVSMAAFAAFIAKRRK